MTWVVNEMFRYADTSGAANDVYEFVRMSNFSLSFFFNFLLNFIGTFFCYIYNELYEFYAG